MKNIFRIMVVVLAGIVFLAACGGAPATPIAEMSMEDLDSLIITPLALSGALDTSWDTPERLDPDTLVKIYYYGHTTDKVIKEEHLEPWVEKHLGVTPELLRLSSFYSTSDKGYLVENLNQQMITISNINLSIQGESKAITFQILDNDLPRGGGLLILQGETTDDFKVLYAAVDSSILSSTDFPVAESNGETPSVSIEEQPESPDMTVDDSQMPTEPMPDLPPVDLQDDGISDDSGEVPNQDPNAPLGSAENPIAEEPIS